MDMKFIHNTVLAFVGVYDNIILAQNEVKATFRLPLDTMKSLKHMAIDKNTSVNALVVRALKEFLKKNG
jgi:hypothetical protein